MGVGWQVILDMRTQLCSQGSAALWGGGLVDDGGHVPRGERRLDKAPSPQEKSPAKTVDWRVGRGYQDLPPDAQAHFTSGLGRREADLGADLKLDLSPDFLVCKMEAVTLSP